MKERPILFSTPMVQAILEGRKTVTRRIVKQTDLQKEPDFFQFIGNSKDIDLPRPAVKYENPTFYGWHPVNNNGITYVLKCPYGEVGDRLWLRETWCYSVDENGYTHFDQYRYKADGPVTFYDADGFETNKSGWKPSIHMPRSASRITLEIVSIRTEQLHDITDTDAEREGVKVGDEGMECWDYLDNDWGRAGFTPTESFETLWQSINGEESWESNPWVWVVEFKIIKP